VGEQGLSEVDCGEGAKLIEVVLHNCRGRIDSSLPSIVCLAVGRLLHPKTEMNSLKVLLLEVVRLHFVRAERHPISNRNLRCKVANSLFYNPLLTLRILEEKHWTEGVLQLWLQMAPSFSR